MATGPQKTCHRLLVGYASRSGERLDSRRSFGTVVRLVGPLRVWAEERRQPRLGEAREDEEC